MQRECPQPEEADIRAQNGDSGLRPWLCENSANAKRNRSRIRILATKFAIGESIAAKLNVRNVRTARGGTWTHVQVGRSSALSTQAWPREAQEAVMATWVKVTTESGETVYVNLDQVARIDRRSGFTYTTIRFGDSRLDAAVTETPEEVFRLQKLT
jgi:hypothetical protein